MRSQRFLLATLACCICFLGIGLMRADADCNSVTLKNTTGYPISLRIHSSNCTSFDVTVNTRETFSVNCCITSVDILDNNGNVIASCNVDPYDCASVADSTGTIIHEPVPCSIPAPWNSILVCNCSVKIGS